MSGPSSSSYIQVPDASTSSGAATAGKVRVVGGYALQQKLGSGSFAVVYKGVRLPDSKTEFNTVAIKAITRTSDKLTAKVLQNLEIEISILRTYRHRNIVCLHDVQKTERNFYLILEYCGGGDVQRLIRTRRAGRLTEGLTRRLMRDLSAGLKFLWGQELIHRDIKPQNLLLTGPLPTDEMNDPEKTDEIEQKRRDVNFPSPQFALKIADFGFARHLESASLAETLCGSPLYMAPEILQHHRYDAKADLWSVGTVLFEMISGRPPFNGENHIDLLRNIQRKAVRLPPDVRVSKECVNLLRLLLNRNPLGRAGFKEFFEACDAFVALGCQGEFIQDEGTCQKTSEQLRSIPENQQTTPPSPPTPNFPSQQLQQEYYQSQQQIPPPPLPPPQSSPPPTTVYPQYGMLQGRANTVPTTTVARVPANRPLEPLVPSPPMSGVSPIQMATTNSSRQSGPRYTSPLQAVEIVHSGRKESPSSLHASTEENSFVMVEHGSYQRSPAASTTADSSRQQQRTPPSSPGYFIGKSPIIRAPGDYVLMRPPKGMLSTSPGTGGALMGFIQGSRRRLTGNDDATVNNTKQIESQILGLTKLLAASEDVGRRAISVAHLGDNRAYLAMHLAMMHEGGSSLLSACPMEGIEEEEGGDHEAGNVTDDEASTEIAATRRRRSSSATDKSMADVKEELEEMPFAIHAEAPPVIAAGMPSRSSNSFTKGYSITASKPTIKPTPAMIRAHFNEALRCYLKTLQMLKGALGATQRVRSEAEALMSQRASQPYLAGLEKLQQRWDITSKWLNEQFNGVLDRADASNNEIAKVPPSQNVDDDKAEKDDGMIVEELIYNHALTCGREGAVKQLLGQFEAARACYRSAGLLAETLLMEQNVSADDRKVLEDYVDGFAARITELDDYMAQSIVKQRNAASSSTGGSRRSSPAVVSLVAQSPMKSPGMNLGPRPFP